MKTCTYSYRISGYTSEPHTIIDSASDMTSLALQCKRSGSAVLVEQNTPPPVCSDKVGGMQTCDNDDVGFVTTGSWKTSTFSAGFEGSNYLHDQNSGKSGKTASWTFENASPDIKRIFVKWTSESNRATAVQYMYRIDGGAAQACGAPQDQRSNGGTFNEICSTPIVNAGQLVTIEVTNDDPSGF